MLADFDHFINNAVSFIGSIFSWGELIRGFALALIIGVIIGTYSSIYVVANMLIMFAINQEDMAIPSLRS